MVSSAFAKGITWGLVESNPVTNSEPPKVQKHKATALPPSQEELVIEAASGPWCLRTLLEIAAALGCRRGELLAVRWSDIADGRVMISRSLSQTKKGLEFKSTKTGEERLIALPASALDTLAAPSDLARPVPRAVWDRLPERPGFGVPGPPRRATKAGFCVRFRLGAVQAAQNLEAKGQGAAPVPAYAHVRLVSRGGSLASRVRTVGPFLRQNDPGDLRPHDNGTR